jgi:predicted anti-sigma-YlaC factor YlaD
MAFAAYVGVQGGGPLAFHAASPAMTATMAGVVALCAMMLVLAWPSVNGQGLDGVVRRLVAMATGPERKRSAS